MFSIRDIFKHYWREARKHQGFFWVTLASSGIGIALSSVMMPLVYREIIDTVVEAPSPGEVADEALMLVVYIAVLVVGVNIAMRIADYTIVKFEARSMRDLANFLFRALESHSYTFFTDQFSGSLVAKARRFVQSFERIFDAIFFNFWFSFVKVAGVMIVLFIVKPAIGFIFLGWMALYGTVTALRIRRQIRFDLAEAAADSKVTAQLADVITNIVNVKIFAREREEGDAFGGVTRDQEEKRRRAWFNANISIAIQGAFLGILEVGSMYYAVTLWLDGAISTGTVVLVQSYLLIIFSALLHIGKQVVRFFQDLTNAQEMVDLLEMPRGVRDPERPTPFVITEGKVSFNSATFRYDEGRHVFRNFSLRVTPGEKIGLVGPSGSGKTTITKLLLRFVDLQSGSIAIDGQDIRESAQGDVRSAIAYVPQEPVLFHRSLRENIAYGKPDATDGEIEDAAKRAHADEFIRELPHGYETLVGERGIKLSGGERQRIAIARAILKDAPILVLDEATSSLDTESEQKIKAALHELMRDKTSIVIAHRLSTIQEMDRIVVLEHGRVVEEGTHEELRDKGGLYASLWAKQTGKEHNGNGKNIRT